MLALGAGRSPATRVAVEPLSSGQHLVPAQGTEGMGRHRETHTDMDGQGDGMLRLPSQGQRYGTPRWLPWHPCKDHSGEPDRDGLQSPWTAPIPWEYQGPPSPASILTPSSPLSTLGTSHGCRRERWGGTAQPGTHSSVSSQHLPSHISHPDAFQIPRDSPRPLSRVPWDPLQVLEGAGRIGHLPRLWAEGTPQSLAHARPSPTHR